MLTNMVSADRGAGGTLCQNCMSGMDSMDVCDRQDLILTMNISYFFVPAQCFSCPVKFRVSLSLTVFVYFLRFTQWWAEWESLIAVKCELTRIFHCRARESGTSSSGTSAVKWQGVRTSANAWLWFWRPTCWAAARPCSTASPSRSRLLRPYRRLL